jgi:hypothetical protein
MKRRAHHIPKVDTGDDYEFMCGTGAFGATVDARDLCQPCTKRALEIVDLLAQAYDELRATGVMPKRRAALMKRINKALGKRPTVDWPKDTETAGPAKPCCACDGDGFLMADSDTPSNERLAHDSRVCTYCSGTGKVDPPGTLRIKDVGDRRVITLTGIHKEKP